MKIAYRYTKDEDFDRLVDLKPGMCITCRVDDESRSLVSVNTLAYPDFVYIVSKIDISKNEVVLIDTSHNNTWTHSSEDLEGCELVQEFHYNYQDIDCDHINTVLINN